jgi:hypothetical protein
MQVRNVHKRRISASATLVGALIDTLASKDDQLWPSHKWPTIKFDDLVKSPKSFFSSFRRKPESSIFIELQKPGPRFPTG